MPDFGALPIHSGPAQALKPRDHDPLWTWSVARLSADIQRLCPQRTEAEAVRLAHVIREHGQFWRQWSPSNPWDKTLDHLLAYARALDSAASHHNA